MNHIMKYMASDFRPYGLVQKAQNANRFGLGGILLFSDEPPNWLRPSLTFYTVKMSFFNFSKKNIHFYIVKSEYWAQPVRGYI